MPGIWGILGNTVNSRGIQGMQEKLLEEMMNKEGNVNMNWIWTAQSNDVKLRNVYVKSSDVNLNKLRPAFGNLS